MTGKRTNVFLGDVCSVFNGKTPAREDQREAGYPVLKIKDVDESGAFKGAFESYVDNEFADRYGEKKIELGDTLILNAAHNSDYVGSKQFYACDRVAGSIATGEWCVVRPDNRRLDKQYASYFLGSSIARHQVKRLVKGIHLYPKDVARIEIPLPPLETQKHIARVLEQADALRKHAQQMETELNQLAQSLFLDMFGAEGNAVDGTKRVKLSELVKRDDDIKCGPFGTQLGKHEFREKGVPLWGIRHVNSNFSIHTHEYVTEEKAIELEQYALLADDIVMTRKGTVGNCHLYPKHFPKGVMHSDLLRIRANKEIVLPIFLVSVLQLSKDVERQIDLISHGAIMAGINVGKLKSIEIELPPLMAQQKFCRALAEIHDKAQMNSQAKTQLSELFNSLLQRAFKGELTAKAA